MIVTKNLTKIFKTFRGKKVVAVDSINFEVRDGDVFGFLGPNGAGKTTTIRMLSGIVTPTSGTAEVCSYDIIREANEVKKRIGLMPENPGFYGEMRAIDLLDFYGKFYQIPRREREQRALKLLRSVGLSAAAKRKVGTFSFGMKKRLALAQALINDPDLLILDEPTGGLDPAGKRDLREKIIGFHKEGKTIFLSSHILHEVTLMCDRVGIINDGKIIAVDNIESLSKQISEKMGRKLEVETFGLENGMLRELEKIDGVRTVKREGNDLEIVVDLDEEIPSDINSYLVSKGVRVRKLVARDPTLEDVFFGLTEEEE